MIVEGRRGDLPARIAVNATGIDKELARDIVWQPLFDLGHRSVLWCCPT